MLSKVVERCGNGDNAMRCQRCSINKWPCEINHVLDKLCRSSDTSAVDSHRLSESIDSNINLVFQPQLRQQAAAIFSNYAGAVRLIDDDKCAISFCQCREFLQRTFITIHRIDRFHCNKYFSLALFKLRLDIVQIIMFKAKSIRQT